MLDSGPGRTTGDFVNYPLKKDHYLSSQHVSLCEWCSTNFQNFGSSAETSEILKCMVEQTDFGKIKIKTKDTTSGAVKAIHLN